MIKEKLAKLIDLKSIITLSLITTLDILIIKGCKLDNNLFLLFSNITTMVVTFYFTKKAEEKKEGK
jgi:hypothetical protein